MTTPAFVRTYPPAAKPLGEEALWFVLRGQELLVRQGASGVEVPRGDEDALFGLRPSGPPLFLGTLRGLPCVAFDLDEATPLPDGLRAMGLRALFTELDAEIYAVAGYAFQIVYWQRACAFCAFCGGRGEPVAGEWSKRCEACGHIAYPRVSPCVIVLVHDGDRVLLTHKPGWGPVYSVIAGFVEPGESLEECLEREVLEEVGAEVDEIRYFGSQPWPFPHQLMVGFFARYRGGELRLDTTELDAAAWFDVNNLPTLPGNLSIARQLLDTWIASRKA
jgi:NAD+ diphosphatase